MPRLTKRVVDAASREKIISALDDEARRDGRPVGKPTRDAFVWDEGLPGFGLKLTASGSRIYVFQYRNDHGQTRRISLGKAGALTPDEARRVARQKQADVVKGADPAEDRRSRRQAPTVRELARRFEDEHIAVHLKPSTAQTYRRLLGDFIIPALGSKQVDTVTRADVAALHHRMRATPRQANQTLAVLSKLFTEAERWGYRQDGVNPCRRVRKYRENRRQRYLSGNELARLGSVLTSMEREGRLSPFVALLFRLLLLTGCRLGEVLTAQWEYVDLDRGVLRLPDSKTGQKTVVLGAPAVDLLRRAPRKPGSPWLITGSRRDASGNWTHHNNPSKAWQRVKAEVAKPANGQADINIDDVRIHDLRHSFASIGAGAGLGLPMIGGLLGHSQAQTTARYSHLADDPLHAAADLVAGEIAALISGGERAQVS